MLWVRAESASAFPVGDRAAGWVGMAPGALQEASPFRPRTSQGSPGGAKAFAGPSRLWPECELGSWPVSPSPGLSAGASLPGMKGCRPSALGAGPSPCSRGGAPCSPTREAVAAAPPARPRGAPLRRPAGPDASPPLMTATQSVLFNWAWGARHAR